MQRIVLVLCAVCVLMLVAGCAMENGAETGQGLTSKQSTEQPAASLQPPDGGSELVDELGRLAERITAETSESEAEPGIELELTEAEAVDDPDGDLPDEDAAVVDNGEPAEEETEQVEPDPEQDTAEELIADEELIEPGLEEDPAPPLDLPDEQSAVEPWVETAPGQALPQNTGELFLPDAAELPLAPDSGLPQNAGELFELEAALEDCCTPGLAAKAQEFVGYWAVVASVNDGDTLLKDRNDSYAFELDEKGCLVLHIRLDDGRVLNLAGAWDLQDSKFAMVLDADDAETSYTLGWHSKDLRILTARNGTKLYIVRLDPAARPARPASSYQSGTFNINFTGHDGKYSGTFAEGRGTLDVTAIGGFLVGSFSRSQADDGVLNGFVILEIEPDRFIGPYWCENCNDFSADWVGER